MTTSIPQRSASASALILLAAAVLASSTRAQQIPGLPDAAVDQPPRASLPAPLGTGDAGPSTPERRVPVAPADPTGAGDLRMPAEAGMPDVADRRGPDQTEEELVRTSLLNRFGSLGFAALGRLTRDGDIYVAEVMTRDRRWIEVVIDPRTGEIGSLADRPLHPPPAVGRRISGRPER